jgi:acyl-CoA synthetase (AMP-forming)/AMP-acid ligase II
VVLTEANSVTAVIREHVRTSGGLPAVAAVTDAAAGPAGTSWWTYADLGERAGRVATWLQQRCAPGDRVLLFFPGGPDFAAALVGCLYAGVVALPAPVPGRYRHELKRAAAIAENSGAVHVLTDSANRPQVSSWAAEVIPHGSVAAIDELPIRPAPLRAVHAGRDTLAVLQYTSGSTSDPKGVEITHGNLLDNSRRLIDAFGLDRHTRFGGWIPNYHDMGLMGQIIPALVLGTVSIHLNPVAFLKRPFAWLQMIGEHGITFSAAPNFAYELCTRRVSDDQLEKLDLSSWRHACNGSEPVRASVLEAFIERFGAAGFRPEAMLPCYGMAEATVFVSGTPHRRPVVLRADPAGLEQGHLVAAAPGGPARELVSCGAVHGMEARIVDPDTAAVLPDDTVGEIWLRGGSVSRGYWRQPSATAATFEQVTADGEGRFLRTGDFGLRHEGDLYVTGRLKETLVIRGRNLYPQDIEHELRAHHQELDAGVGAVFTVPDNRGAEVLVLTHEIKGRMGEAQLADLAGAMRQTVAREFGVHAGGVALMRRGGVRRTTSGKIQRAAMRRLFLGGELETMHLDGIGAPGTQATSGDRGTR